MMLLAGVLGSAGAAFAVSPPEPIRVVPVDGGHWQSGVGLPGSRGNADQALVRVVDGSDDHPEVAAITGLEGEDTSALESFGFTVAGEDVGIIPCVRVAFTDALGNQGELMFTRRTMRSEPSRTPGWTVYTFDTGLPPGATIEEIEIGVHSESNPPDPVRVLFDDVMVNGQVFTHAGDNAMDPTNA